MTKHVETARKLAKMDKKHLCMMIGIEHRTYNRRVNSDNGFTELELTRAFAALKIKLAIIPDGVWYIT